MSQAVEKKKVRIVIDKEGKYTLTALEGFQGESCDYANKGSRTCSWRL